MTADVSAPVTRRTSLLRLISGAAAFSALWAVLAVVNPTTTYHLAPLIVPFVPLGMSLSEQASRLRTATLAAGGIAVVVSLALGSAGKLAGPSLLPTGGALLESLVFSGAATAAALAVTASGFRLRRP